MVFLKVFKLILVFFALSALVSCDSSDGGANSSADTAATTGRVSLLITDGITDDFDQVNLTVESISFLSEDNGHETIVFNESRVVNLLALQNYSDLLVTAVIPAGTYDKIRLHVGNVELVKFLGEGLEPIVCNTKLPANGKVDLNPRGTFDVVGDGHLMVELDIDAEKSIHIVEKGKAGELCENKYNFRPVVFVNILEVADESKLVLLDGKVLEKYKNGFQLCKAEDLEVNEGCLGVVILGDDVLSVAASVTANDVKTVVQNDLIEMVLSDSIVDGDIVTVLGKLNSGSSVDALHIVIEDNDKEVSDLALFAGAATSVVDAGIFTMTTDSENAIVPPLTDLTVSLLEGSGVRIFDKHGTEVGPGVIAFGTDVDVFGLIMPEANVKAAFVILDNEDLTNRISGTITTINETESQLMVLTEVVGGTGDVCVDAADTVIFMLAVVDGRVVTEEITLGELHTDMPIDVYGEYDDSGCFVAEVILVADPVAVPLGATLLVTGN